MIFINHICKREYWVRIPRMPPPCTPPHWKPDKPALDALEAQISDSIPSPGVYTGDRTPFGWRSHPLFWSSFDSIPGRDSFTHLDLYTGTGLIYSFGSLYRDGTHLDALEAQNHTLYRIYTGDRTLYILHTEPGIQNKFRERVK